MGIWWWAAVIIAPALALAMTFTFVDGRRRRRLHRRFVTEAVTALVAAPADEIPGWWSDLREAVVTLSAQDADAANLGTVGGQPVPRVTDLTDAYRRTADLVAAQRRAVRVLLAQADVLGIPLDPEARAGLSDALKGCEAAELAAIDALSSGGPLAALSVLVHADLPVTESGIPGQAGRQTSQRILIILRKAALDHAERLALWRRRNPRVNDSTGGNR
jgi:hypothetical protein